LVRTGAKVAQCKVGGVVKGLSRSLPESLVLISDTRLVERRFHVEHGFFRRLQHSIESTKNRHRQDHIAILAANVEVPEHVICDSPDEVSNPVEIPITQILKSSENRVRLNFIDSSRFVAKRASLE
jgi:hypothetical protein